MKPAGQDSESDSDDDGDVESGLVRKGEPEIIHVTFPHPKRTVERMGLVHGSRLAETREQTRRLGTMKVKDSYR